MKAAIQPILLILATCCAVGLAIPFAQAETLPDSDKDGMPDAWEKTNRLDPGNAADAVKDPDEDGVSNLDEYKQGTNPRNHDSDKDGLVDGRGKVVSWGQYPYGVDMQKDGFIDGEADYGTSPSSDDTDKDGMPDGWEVFHGLKPTENDAKADLDGDGVANLAEWQYFVNRGCGRLIPNKVDTDEDGLADGTDGHVPTNAYPFGIDANKDGFVDGERDPVNNSCPVTWDTDGDGLLDGKGGRVDAKWMVNKPHKRNPLYQPVDMDRDGKTDGEYDHGTSPCKLDTDGDGFDDRWEVIHAVYTNAINPVRPDPDIPDMDFDGDGLSTRAEFLLKTDPFKKDSDQDGLIDGRARDSKGRGILRTNDYPIGIDHNRDGFVDGERDHNTDPASGDSDGDRLTDYWELKKHGTDPANHDTDGDGHMDILEVYYESNPTNIDSDADGLVDAYDLRDGKTPVATVEAYPGGVDGNGDGIVDGEANYGTYCNDADSDRDGIPDGKEVRNRTDPMDAGDPGRGRRRGPVRPRPPLKLKKYQPTKSGYPRQPCNPDPWKCVEEIGE